MITVYVVVFAFGLVLSARSVVKRDWERLGLWVPVMIMGMIGMSCAGLQLGRIAGAYEFVEFGQ